MTIPTIAIGVSDFREIRQDGHYYIDKSLLAEEIMADGSKIILLPRPRRFGKTLNLSMLSYFFDCMPPAAEDYAALFRDLAITQSPAWQHQGQYPVVFFTFKELKLGTFKDNQELLISLLQSEAKRHRYLLSSDRVDEEDKEELTALIKGRPASSTLNQALLILTRVLHQHHGQPAMLLLDEYDTPLIYAHSQGYYEPMLTLIRSLLGSALKGNSHIKKAIVTGILRVAKESMFSGLNNLSIATVLDTEYADKFGFTPTEVQQALQDFGLGDRYEEVNQWYNGYTFGHHQIYNPWSVLNYLKHAHKGFKPYWVNTSNNALIMEQLDRANYGTIEVLEELIQGGSIESTLQDHTVFHMLDKAQEAALFSMLVFSGYLKARYVRDNFRGALYELSLPNREVRWLFNEGMLHYLSDPLNNRQALDLLRALLDGDAETFGRMLQGYVLEAFSFFDLTAQEPEKVYHGFMMGTLGYMAHTHEILSNREVGLGRADMQIKPRDPQDRRAYLLEFKKAPSASALEASASEALQQIHGRQYSANLLADGYAVHHYGIAFYGKQLALQHQLASR